MYVDRLELLDAVVLLKDQLDVLYSEEQITQTTYSRKKSLRNLVRAVNKADRMISNVRKSSETVALFLPKDIHIFPLGSHDVYAGDQIDSIAASALSALHPAGIDLFINREPWHTIHAIKSEKLSLYAKHPTDSWEKTGTVRRVPASDFNASRPGGNIAFFDTENRVLHLSHSLPKDQFIAFEAHTIPGLLRLKNIDASTIKEARDTVLCEIEIKTPALHEDLLMDVALSKLLPGQSERVGPASIMAALQGSEPANGATVTIPEGQFGGFG